MITEENVIAWQEEAKQWYPICKKANNEQLILIALSLIIRRQDSVRGMEEVVCDELWNRSKLDPHQ